MKRNIRRLLISFTLIVGLLFLAVPQRVSAITVSGKACPFFAGQTFPVPPATTGDSANYHGDQTDPTIMPPHIGVCSGSTVSISAVGIWGHPPLSGPDGTEGRDDTHDEYVELGGISRILAPLNTLVGVFLTDDPPDPGAMPDSLNLYLGDEMITPELQQAFAIGSSLENITVPEGATRLFFGLNDGYEWFNNVGSLEVTVTTIVYIDIKPGSYPNPINPDSEGLVPVAILSSPEFDATTVDATTVKLAGAPVAVRGKGKLMAHVEDVDEDGLLDLVVQVETQDLDLGDGGTVELMLTGTTFGGEDIVGYDEVVIVPPEKLPVLVETVTVYANDLNGEDSTEGLLDGVDYRIEVSGTWTNKAGGPDAFPVDAEYVSYDGWTNWQDGPDPIPEEPGERRNQLDLQVDQTFVDWGEFSTDHSYSIDLPGSGSTVNFRVYDGFLAVGPDPGWYPDNDGSLTVTIYRLP